MKAGPDYHRLKTMLKRSIEQNIRNKNFETTNVNYERNVVTTLKIKKIVFLLSRKHLFFFSFFKRSCEIVSYDSFPIQWSPWSENTHDQYLTKNIVLQINWFFLSKWQRLFSEWIMCTQNCGHQLVLNDTSSCRTYKFDQDVCKRFSIFSSEESIYDILPTRLIVPRISIVDSSENAVHIEVKVIFPYNVWTCRIKKITLSQDFFFDVNVLVLS